MDPGPWGQWFWAQEGPNYKHWAFLVLDPAWTLRDQVLGASAAPMVLARAFADFAYGCQGSCFWDCQIGQSKNQEVSAGLVVLGP